jgi:hypothetical protein
MLELSSDDVEVDPRVVELSVHSAATSQPYRTPLALLSRLIDLLGCIAHCPVVVRPVSVVGFVQRWSSVYGVIDGLAHASA